MFAVTFAATATVVAVKATALEPAGTVTDGGTVVLGSLDVRVMTSPPGGAGAATRTTPADEVPPTTVLGVRETDRLVAELTEMVAVTD
jgi:hypothetical protein